MNNLTTEQIARIFAMYLGQRITCPGRPFHANRNSLNEQGRAILSPSILADCHEHTFSYTDFKIHLRPLSAISDEDAIEVANLSHPFAEDASDANKVRYAKNITLAGVYSNSVFQYLIQQGYAVSLFIAPGHPDNGKTAIEFGLAIDSTLNP